MSAPQEQEIRRLTNLVLRFLSYRSRSRQEITSYLQRQTKHPSNQEIINQVLDKISQFNLLNDNSFTQEWIRSRLKKGKGPRLIRLELKQKGIEIETINQHLNQVPFEKLLDSAIQLLNRKSRQLKHSNSYQHRAKMSQYLYSRGYSQPIINQAIDEYLSDRVK